MMIKWLVILIGFVSCTRTPEVLPYMTLKECLEVYKLDGTHFADDAHLVVNVVFNELLVDSMRYPMEVYDSVISNLNQTYALANISYRLKAVNCCNPVPYITVTSISKYAKQYNDPKALNIYILPDDTLDYRGASVSIPSIACGIQRAWIGTSTACHELGHMQGLKHIHEPDKTNKYNIKYGDQICDTPSPTEDHLELPDCFRKLFDKTTDESLVILRNTMSYSFYICRTNLTLIQAAKIRLAYELNTELKGCIYKII